MANDIYILSACDAWAGNDSMRIQGVTTDKTMLYAMLLDKIRTGDMEYGGDGKNSHSQFLSDFNAGEVNMDKLKYGFVQTYVDMQIDNFHSYNSFGIGNSYWELLAEKQIQDIGSLNLDERSLTYSVVEVRTDFGYECFMLPGICDRDALESSDQFQELMEDEAASEVNVNVYSYCVGNGESQSPSEDELKIIENYQEELEDEYGIDPIQSDFISFYYEPEQEY